VLHFKKLVLASVVGGEERIGGVSNTFHLR
jgi:hypothetical protein